MVIQGNRLGAILLLATLCISRTVFEILPHKARKYLVFLPHTRLTPPLQEPIRISNENYAAKTRRMGLLHGEKNRKFHDHNFNRF